MKIVILLVVSIFAFNLKIPYVYSVDDPSRIIIAEVNSHPVYLDSLLRVLNRSKEDKTENKKSIMDLLDELIYEELAFQKAKERGLKADERSINNALMELKMDLGEKGFEDYMKKNNLSEEKLRYLIERKILIEMLYSEEVIKKVIISEEYIIKEYEIQKKRFRLPERIIVVDVKFLLKPDATDSIGKALALRHKIINELNGDVWRLIQDGAFIVSQIRLNKEKQKELYDVARGLKIGEISDIIKASDGLHIIKLIEHEEERYPTLDEMRFYLEGQLYPSAVEKREKEWREELRKGASIKVYEENLIKD
jgi:hypothetical protein